MKRIALLLFALGIAGCAGVGTPPPAVVPPGDERFLIDPRTGYTGGTSPAVERRLETAWRYFVAGNTGEAERRLHDLQAKNPGYLPAEAALAAIAIRGGQLEAAQAILDRLAARQPGYTAVDVYLGELAMARNDVRAAY